MKKILSLLAAVACCCGGEVLGQETVEIQYALGDGVSRTVEVDRDIEKLDLNGSTLTSIILPEGLTNLNYLYLYNNQLTSFTLPEGLTNLNYLYLYNNQLTSFTLPNGLVNLEHLYLHQNQWTNLTLPNDLTSLEHLYLGNSQLTSFTLPEGLTNLEWLYLSGNQLINLTLPEGLANLKYLDLVGNQLTNFTLPEGLTSLERLNLWGNQLTSLTLAEDTAKFFSRINTDRALAYNLEVVCAGVPLKKVILPKRLDGKVYFSGMEDDVYNNLEFLFLEDLRMPKITRAGDALEITWEIGVLQTSASIEGPWKDVRASSPLRFIPSPSIPVEFFRLRAE